MADEPMIEPKRMTQQDLDRQRALGWVEFHPEDYCHRCGNPNCVWWVDSAVWNAVMRRIDGSDRWSGIVCPSCFLELAGGLSVEIRVNPDTKTSVAFLETVEGGR